MAASYRVTMDALLSYSDVRRASISGGKSINIRVVVSTGKAELSGYKLGLRRGLTNVRQ